MCRFIFSILTLAAILPLRAQAIHDAEMSSLIGIVRILRAHDEAAFNRAARLLADDSKWTTMNELGPLKADECPPSEGTPGFKLNRILSKIERSRKYSSTHGDMLNGEDERYDYSLYERSIRGGRSVTYKLSRRVGRQTFVIVPFESSGHGLTATVSVDGGKPISFVESNEVLVVDCVVCSADSDIAVTVSEKSGANRSFVLINHNSRRK